MKKVMLMMIVFVMVLSITALAVSVSEWELGKLSQRFETRETRGALVMKTADGEVYILEFDMESGMVSTTIIDENGDIDVETCNITEDEYEFSEIYFLH